MTIAEFNNMRFGNGVKAEYKGERFKIISVDFEESLVGLLITEDDDIHWVRCENISIVNE